MGLEARGEAVGGGPADPGARRELGRAHRGPPATTRGCAPPCPARRSRLQCPLVENPISECETRSRRHTGNDHDGKTLSEKVWDRHVVHQRRRRRPALHRPPPGPRGHLAAGLRRAPPQRPARSAAPTSRWPPRTTTSRPPTSTSRSPTRSAPSSSRRSRPTAPSSASPTTASATRCRASSTSSAPSRATPSRA